MCPNEAFPFPARAFIQSRLTNARGDSARRPRDTLRHIRNTHAVPSRLRPEKSLSLPTSSMPVPAPRRSQEERSAFLRPALTLIVGPAGAGKTEWTLNRCCAAAQEGSRALLIVSSAQQAQTRAAQIAARLQCAPDAIPVSILTFRQLVLNLAGSGEEDGEIPCRPIGRAFQRMALNDLFQRVIQPDDFLGRMRRAPGFVPAFAERLREWKLACLTPDLLEQFGPAVAAELSDPTFTRKTAELSRLFHAYETFLTRNRLRDEEDGLRAAIAGARSGAARLDGDVSCVLVDGFYRFNPMQRLLLAALAQQTNAQGNSVEVAVTLPCEERRPLLFAAPMRALNLLRQEFDCRETVLDYRSPVRPAALARLSDHLFGSGPKDGEEGERGRGENKSEKIKDKRNTGTGEDKLPATGNKQSETAEAASLTLFDAPNPYVEAEMVARQFRRLYDAGGYAWSDFAVILRAMGDYAPILAAVFERHGIPLGVDGPEVLAENPFIKTLLALLSVLRRGWQREDVLAFLKSSYTAPDRLEADSLRRRARQSGVREGRERWLQLGEAKREKIKDNRGTEQDGVASVPNQPNFSSAEASVDVTLRDMAHYDALLTRERRDPREFAALIEESVAFSDWTSEWRWANRRGRSVTGRPGARPPTRCRRWRRWPRCPGGRR